jgi:tRNA(fMet)-specific endonuclease VapC
MEDRICLDTDFLVNFLRNKKEEVEFIKNHESGKYLATTCINAFELYYGAYKSNRKDNNLRAIASLLNTISILDFSTEVAEKSGELMAKLEKEGHLMDFRDLFIGTLAFVNNHSLKTYNKKHFMRIKGLDLV